MYSCIWSSTGRIEKDNYKPERKVNGLVPLLWREHCLECSMPLCYETCHLYKKRMDGRCLRFEHGIIPVNGGGVEIEFRRWAKLQSEFVGFPILSTVEVRFISWILYIGENMIRTFCRAIRNYRLCQIWASLVERINTCMARRLANGNMSGFYAVIRNDMSDNLKLIFEITKKTIPVYKTAFDLKPGWNEYFIDGKEIFNLGNDRGGTVRCYLEGDQSGKLMFKMLDFVRLYEPSQQIAPAKKVKCVAWDLDNTMWDGIIGEVGADGVGMKPESVALVKALDERGIIQTIASKNTQEIAWPKLEAEGLAEYFLYPAINWGRKSESLKGIAKSLNINIDTFALIDDSSFERNEVKTALPQVRVYNVTDVPGILGRDEFDIPVTEASRRRRLSYKEEEKRNGIKASWGGDYDSFLRSCELKMDIFIPAEDADFKRCLELLNRSNQYNISGKRYSDEELKEFVSHSNVLHYAFRVKDKYGDYGIVGYATIVCRGGEWKLVDFVMSCRVAQKKVERAFVGWLHGIIPNGKSLVVTITKSDRNKPLQDEFRAMPFKVEKEDETTLSLVFLHEASLNDGIMEVIAL